MEPDGRQTLYVLGYPKSGTTWLARLLGDVLDCPVGAAFPTADDLCIAREGEDRPGPFYVRQGHSVPVERLGVPLVPVMGEFAYQNMAGERVVLVVRDPRDLILSVAHHWNLSQEKALHCMASGAWPVTHGGGLTRYLRAWVNRPFGYALTSYEELSQDAAATVTRLLDVWSIAADPERIEEAVERQSFKARRAWTAEHGDGLAYGKEFQLRFLRRGMAGAWRDELERRLWPEVWANWEWCMRLFGYADGPEWMAG